MGKFIFVVGFAYVLSWVVTIFLYFAYCVIKDIIKDKIKEKKIGWK